MIKVNIRWSDIDANRHLANSAYINFMSYARVVYMKKSGISHKELAQLHMGPVVFYEHIYFFKEVLPDQPVYINVELAGASADGMFFAFRQDMYDKSGRHMATYDMMGAWIDMNTRKLTTLHPDILRKFNTYKRTEDFKILTKEDTRKFNKTPRDIDPQLISNHPEGGV